MKFPSARSIERLPWAVRGLLGCAAAGLAITITYTIEPLRAFPLMMALPAVILSAWFLGMWAGVICALTEAMLVNAFLTRGQLRFSFGHMSGALRLAVFVAISTALGWAVRRLAEQRSQLANQELQRQLLLADTERRLAEERARAGEVLRDREALLQLALQANGMGVWVWDLEHGEVHWSDEMFRMAGHEPGSVKPSFDAWTQIMHPEDAARLAEARRQSRETGKEYREQYRVQRPDGSVRWLESQGKGQWDSEGRFTRVVGVLSDVTHRKQTEEAMLRAEKLAVAGRLAASVAHEINNPLEAVGNLLFLITLTDSVESAKEHAGRALDELMRVSMITQQTLKFHRQTGAPKITRLSEVVESVLTLFRGRLRAAEIAVDLRAEEETSVACMPSEAQQIFANLISNAIDAMAPGGRLAIRLRPSRDWRDAKTAGMRVTFCDSGSGVDRATMRRIFEPFFTTKADTGTGLGLWVVAQLVERHRGHVRAWSSQRPGASGTAFSVFLPFSDAPVAEGVAEGSFPQTVG